LRALEAVVLSVVVSVATGYGLVWVIQRDAVRGNPHAQAALGGLWAWTVEREGR